MTKEKLKKGQELLERINRLVQQKEYWEDASAFGEAYIKSKVYQRESYHGIDPSFIDFDLTKGHVLTKINDLINKLQKEFDEL